MLVNKPNNPNDNSKLHPRNRHREGYDYELLMARCPALKPFVKPNHYKKLSIEFVNPEAVKMLNRALLQQYYDIEYWDFPKGYFCPSVPDRADHLHHVADLLAINKQGLLATGSKIKCLDIGVGANCIYPILGAKEYGWSFVGADIDEKALASSQKIIDSNPNLKDLVSCRLQPDPDNAFYGILEKNEVFDVVMCHPPLYATQAAAKAGTFKSPNYNAIKKVRDVNVAINGENWCEGGEIGFIKNMIRESKQFSNSAYWFTTVVLHEPNISMVLETLDRAAPIQVRTVPMGQIKKITYVVAWSFLPKLQQEIWVKNRWAG
jgi:23S rRNA (adenine1618-N6)-methyltransferase